MKRILCYGDSNTWGYMPGTGVRYAPDVRWTGILQKELGDEALVIEEGLNGRTTVYDHPATPYRNGLSYLMPCLISQKPLDLVVLMLGTNDLGLTDAYGAVEGARCLCKQIRLAHYLEESTPIFTEGPRILLMAPPLAHEAMNQRDRPERIRHYPEESHSFARLYEGLAQELGLDYLDAAAYTCPSPIDGVHLDAESHRRLGLAVAEKIREILF